MYIYIHPPVVKAHIHTIAHKSKLRKHEEWSLISAAHLVFHSSLPLSRHIHLPPPASLRPSPSVSDSSLVCCQSSYMSEQAAVHSSWTLLCTQGIPSPVSSPQLALCFCLCRSSRFMPSPLSLTLGLQSGCAKWAVAYLAPCGAFLRFHMLLLSQSAQQLALWAWCLQGEKKPCTHRGAQRIVSWLQEPRCARTHPWKHGILLCAGSH